MDGNSRPWRTVWIWMHICRVCMTSVQVIPCEPCPVSHCECQIDATRLHRCTAKIKSTFFTTACLPGQKKSSAARRSFGFAESCIAKINLHHLRPRVHKRARVWETSQTTEVCSSQVFAPHSRASSTTSELSNLLGWHLSAYLPALRQAQSATCQDATRNLRKFKRHLPAQYHNSY